MCGITCIFHMKAGGGEMTDDKTYISCGTIRESSSNSCADHPHEVYLSLACFMSITVICVWACIVVNDLLLE